MVKNDEALAKFAPNSSSQFRWARRIQKARKDDRAAALGIGDNKRAPARGDSGGGVMYGGTPISQVWCKSPG